MAKKFNIPTLHIKLLRMIHDCQEIVVIVISNNTASGAKIALFRSDEPKMKILFLMMQMEGFS